MVSLETKPGATLDDVVVEMVRRANELKQIVTTRYKGIILMVLPGDSAEELILRYEEDLRQRIEEEREREQEALFARIEEEREREEEANLVEF